MGKRRTVWAGLLGWGVAAAFLAATTGARAQDARTVVQQAVSAEQAASRDDHTLWKYMQHESNGDLFVVVETKNGSMKRHVMENGHPASQQTLAADDSYNNRFV